MVNDAAAEKLEEKTKAVVNRMLSKAENNLPRLRKG